MTTRNMNISKNIITKNQSKLNIGVIGGGIVGSTTAIHLTNLGHEVALFDPHTNSIVNHSLNRNGSQASLGILMGYVYRRSTGRSWALRKRSMELWPKLIQEISSNSNSLKINTPLVQLAKSEKEFYLLEKLVEKKANYKIELLNKNSITYFKQILNKKQYGGVISYEDGRIEPLQLLKCMSDTCKKYGIKQIAKKVTSLKRKTNKEGWTIYLDDQTIMQHDLIVICAALESEKLLKPLGHIIKLEPILGQVLELEYDSKDFNNDKFPAVLNNEGFNLIPKGKNKMLIGSTLEPGINASLASQNQLHNMNGNAPNWIKNGSIKSKWNGIRARPLGQVSPILKTIEPGLIINSAHYRNGILLAPACAEWVGIEISKRFI